ncbi:MAG: hypothetical protein HN700_16520 [Verrucomicrobia bacterium]|nr:hypothetical protein [Verrucomicrobiota bacterium]
MSTSQWRKPDLNTQAKEADDTLVETGVSVPERHPFRKDGRSIAVTTERETS